MSRIQALKNEQFPSQVVPMLDAVNKKLGMIPNMFRTLAQAPAALGVYLQASEAIAKGSLTAAEREVVALAVGQANECGYCLAAHTMIGKGAGLADDAIKAARSGSGTAIAVLAQRLTVTRGNLSNDDIATARAKGVTDEQLLEVIALVAINTLTNYVNHVAATDIDFPAVSVR